MATRGNPTLPVGRVLDYTARIRMERDYWQRTPAMAGIFTWNEDESVAAAARWLERAIETQTSDGMLNYSNTDRYANGHVSTLTPTAALSSGFGYNMMLLYERSGDTRHLEAAKRQMEALLDCPRTSTGGFWSRKEGPELWIDFVFMICPFLARIGRVLDRDDLVDEAYQQFLLHAEKVVDPATKLGRHAWLEVPNSYPQSTFWSRGNGWMMCAAYVLADEAPDHPSADKVLRIARDMTMAIEAYQDRSGYVRHVIDDPESDFESSGTCMYAYAAARGHARGDLDDSYLESAKRALSVVTGVVGEDGGVDGVSVPPGGPGVPFGVGPLGQGFYLMAAHALRDHFDVDMSPPAESS